MTLIEDIKIKNDLNNEEYELLKIAYELFCAYYKDKTLIENVFKNIPLFIKKEKGKVKALYARRIYKKGKDIRTKAKIVIRKNDINDLNDLLDEVVHEYNEAINTYNNELDIDNNQVVARRGLELKVMTKRLKTNKIFNTLLEEVINAYQSEEILSLLKDDDFNIENNVNTVKYRKESFLIKDLLNNSSFMKSLNQARLTGNIKEFEQTIYDKFKVKNFLFKLNNLLEESNSLEKSFKKKEIFKFIIKRKLEVNRDRINNLILSVTEE